MQYPRYTESISDPDSGISGGDTSPAHLEEYDSINEQEHVLGEIFCLEKRHIKSTIPSI